MTTEPTEIRTGYHIRVRHKPWRVIVVHGPTENWQHRPRANPPKDGYWVGPIANKSRAEQVAWELADKHGYGIELCKTCYSDRQMPPPTRGEGIGGPTIRRRRQRDYEPVGGQAKRQSRGGT